MNSAASGTEYTCDRCARVFRAGGEYPELRAPQGHEEVDEPLCLSCVDQAEREDLIEEAATLAAKAARGWYYSEGHALANLDTLFVRPEHAANAGAALANMYPLATVLVDYTSGGRLWVPADDAQAMQEALERLGLIGKE